MNLNLTKYNSNIKLACVAFAMTGGMIACSNVEPLKDKPTEQAQPRGQSQTGSHSQSGNQTQLQPGSPGSQNQSTDSKSVLNKDAESVFNDFYSQISVAEKNRATAMVVKRNLFTGLAKKMDDALYDTQIDLIANYDSYWYDYIWAYEEKERDALVDDTFKSIYGFTLKNYTDALHGRALAIIYTTKSESIEDALVNPGMKVLRGEMNLKEFTEETKKMLTQPGSI